MKNIKTFESYDPNNQQKKKYQISSTITKSDYFALRNKEQKAFIKKIVGILQDDIKPNPDGKTYSFDTKDKDIGILEIPKKFIYEA